MEERKPDSVPYIIHEGAMARAERHNRRLLIALAITVIAMLLNNVAWLVFESHNQQRTEITQEYES